MAQLKITQAGMTLLEVLVAISLMVVISAISYTSLNGLITAKQHTDEVAKRLRQELLTSQQLNKDIHSILQKRHVKDEYGGKRAAIIGGFSSIEFTRNGNINPQNANNSELYRVRWFFRDNALYRGTLDYLDRGNFSKWQIHKYMVNINEFAINFIDKVGQESQSWPVANNNLQLEGVQISLVMNNSTTLKYQMRVPN